MEVIFLKILNMSVTASWLIVVVILFRMLFQKVPKFIHCVLWGMVAIRLICPISFESVWSLIPSKEPISTDILYEPNVPPIQNNDSVVNEVVNEEMIPDTLIPTKNPLQLLIQWSCVVWMIGMGIMIVIYVVSYIRIYDKVKYSMRRKENIWLCDAIDTPFILGFLRPQIYLPSDLTEEQVTHIVAHEQAHIRRCDHWWKPIGFFILSVYWFHPLVWISYILLCRDIELACDERVVKKMEVEEKKAYSETLLTCSISRHMIMACPLAFGEVGVKMRIQSILSNKKASLGVVALAIITCIVVAMGFLTDQKEEKQKETENVESSEETLDEKETESNTELEFFKGEVIFYSEAKKLVEGLPLEIVYSDHVKDQRVYYGYERMDEQERAELEEILALYFKCFFYPDVWGNYSFIADSTVLVHWEENYNNLFRKTNLAEAQKIKSSITVEEILYYHNGMCIVDVKINEDEIHHIHLVKEQKWEIKQDIISAKKCTMEYCQSIQKIRSKTALKDDVIQQGIDACLAEDFPESITKYGNAKNISKEDFAQLKLQSECLYDKGWSDELLIRCMMAQEFQGNLKEPVFVVWMQPKEGYDESLKKVADWVYGNDGGLYFLVWYSSNTKEWNSHMISQITPPAFSVRDAQN